MATLLEKFLRNFTFVRRLERRIGWLESEAQRLEGEKAQMVAETTHWRKFVPPGHFYSPLPSPSEIADAGARDLFEPKTRFAALDLREAEQLALAEKFAEYYPQQPFSEKPTPGRRFYLDNPSYSHHDAIILYCMLRHLQPKRIIEVGSGFSSAALLDINSFAMDGRMHLTFIDPDMTRLRPLLGVGDEGRATLIEQRLQELPLDVFAALEANDVLFIDSSHVSKVGSDLHRLIFDILPVLRPGVHVHIHDVPGNLEYPRDWFEEGRAWNEVYLLRAFLMYNRAFVVKFFSMWFYHNHHAFLRAHLPLCAQGGGGQIWLCRAAL
jgi:predicted O-methyltransferase YrrM